MSEGDAETVRLELGAAHRPSHICVRTYEDGDEAVFDRLHVDRHQSTGKLMRRTLLIYLDEECRGGTCFPYLKTMVRGDPGRLLSFSSHDARSAHFGVRTAAGTRVVAVIGWDGEGFDLGGHHAMLDDESAEVRASFWGRTVDEELVGWIGGPRHGEGMARLREIAERRGTSVRRLVAEEEERRVERMERRTNAPRLTFPLLRSPRRSDVLSAEETTPPAQVYHSKECPVCHDDEVMMLSLQCGHVLCPACRDSMLHHHQLCDAKGRLKCPVCRHPSGGAWPVDPMLC